MGNFHKSIQLMLELLKGPFLLGPTIFKLYISDLPDDVISTIAVCADGSTFYSNCAQASGLWLQLELPSVLESDVWETVDWNRMWLVHVNAGIAQFVLFGWSNNIGAIVVNMDWSVREEKSSFKMLGLSLSSKWDCGSYFISIAKNVSKKIGDLIRSIKFLSPEVVIYPYKSGWCS